MAVTKTSQLPASATVQKTSQLPPEPKPTIQYKAHAVRPLEPAGHKIARVLMPKTTASVQAVGVKKTVKNAAISGAKQAGRGAAAGFSYLARGAPAFIAAPPPTLTMRSSGLPKWVLGGGYPWQKQPAERRSKKARKKDANTAPEWIRY